MITSYEYQIKWKKLKNLMKDNSDILSIMEEIDSKEVTHEELENESLQVFFDKIQDKVENEKQQSYVNMIKKLSYDNLTYVCNGFNLGGYGDDYFIEIIKDVIGKRNNKVHHLIAYYFKEKGYRSGYYPIMESNVLDGYIEFEIQFSGIQKDMFDRNDISIEQILKEVYSEFELKFDISVR